MNKLEMIDKLAKNGIHVLNKGESIADALAFVDGEIASRKGFRDKFDSGKPMTKNQQIMNSNKEAFLKSCPPVEYNQDTVEHIDDISLDYREDTSSRGRILNCYYCGTAMRVDGGDSEEHDYEPAESIEHCDDKACFSNAIRVNCM
jgi:hypothetical protein